MSTLTRRAMLGALGAPAFAAAPRKPNIVLLMADDMGFSDIGCYGSEIETPNIDALARGGVRFTHFTNTARCCPTRASLLTGMYSHQVGIGHMVSDDGLPGYRGELSRQHATIAEALRPAGYRSGMFGKWHVAPANAKFQSNWPLQRGFDYFYGTPHGGGNHFNPTMTMRNNDVLPPAGDGYYFTDAIVEEANQFIRSAAADKKPFFTYVAFTAPHWPLHAFEADVKQQQGRYAAGWDELRARRYQRMKQLGVVDPKWGTAPRPGNVSAWNEVADKDWQMRRMEVYAAQVHSMDRAIGRLIATLKQTGAWDNTLVLFLSDNGGSAEINGPNAGLPAYGTHTHDGRLIRRGNNPAVLPGPEDTFQSYGREWTHLSNTPFRLHKMMVHEGGISTPLVAHWPAGLRRPGRVDSSDGHVIDLMATCCEAAGVAAPNAIEGKSLLPVLAGRRRSGHKALFYEHEGNRAIRKQGWKLVQAHGQAWELYNLRQDRCELSNLAATLPDKKRELETDYQTWALRAQVVDWTEIQRLRRQKQEAATKKKE
jgi:arylsulfatase A-like enzyme